MSTTWKIVYRNSFGVERIYKLPRVSGTTMDFQNNEAHSGDTNVEVDTNPITHATVEVDTNPATHAPVEERFGPS